MVKMQRVALKAIMELVSFWHESITIKEKWVRNIFNKVLVKAEIAQVNMD